jgi:hypothetical protein
MDIDGPWLDPGDLKMPQKSPNAAEVSEKSS